MASNKDTDKLDEAMQVPQGTSIQNVMSILDRYLDVDSSDDELIIRDNRGEILL